MFERCTVNAAKTLQASAMCVEPGADFETGDNAGGEPGVPYMVRFAERNATISSS